jgi:class 3 adenylate cyclase
MSARPASEAWLQPARGERVVLQGNCRLGRAPDNHVVIHTTNASRHHAAIHAQEQDEFWLLDLDSANGTFLNGHRLLRPTRLRDGDRVVIGETTLVFRQAVTLTASPTSAGLSTATIVEFKDQPAWLLMADMQGFSELCQNAKMHELALTLTTWFRESQRLIEQRGGRIAKYLGDGFLAYWTPSAGGAAEVAESLRELHRHDRDRALRFRFVVHHGSVTFGGAATLGEERMIGPEVNFIFRLEKLAAQLGLAICLSAPAHAQLAPLVPAAPVDGEHSLKGFPGRHRCFQIDWPSA